MAQLFKCRPSEVVFIEDNYTAFCLDEACAFIYSKISQGETPLFRRHYTSFKEAFAKYETS